MESRSRSLLSGEPPVLVQKFRLALEILIEPHFTIAQVVKALGWWIPGFKNEPDTPIQMRHEGEHQRRSNAMLHLFFSLHPTQPNQMMCHRVFRSPLYVLARLA